MTAKPASYVVGFAFGFYRRQVLLIEKTKPFWQRGLLNGVGGKIEAREAPELAMIREFREETGIETGGEWERFATLHWRGHRPAKVFFYRAFGTKILEDAVSTTRERVFVVQVQELIEGRVACVPNLRVLIPLAILPSDLILPVHFHCENWDSVHVPQPANDP